MPQAPEGRIKIVAENLARAALAELKRDVGGAGTAAGGASVGFGKMVFQHGQLIASTQGARKGLNILENGLRTLAFSAAGVPGPVGKIASGFGLLGAGSLVVTGAVAGAGLLALGYQVLTRNAREAAEAADKLTDSLKKQTAGGQLRAISASLTAASQDVLNSQVAGDQGGLLGGWFERWVAWIRQVKLESAGVKAVAAAAAVRDARTQQHAELIKNLEHEADLIGTTTAEAARLKAGWLGLTEAETANYIAAATRLERRKEENRVLEAQRDLLQEISLISQEVAAFGAFNAPDLAALKLPDILGEEAQRQASLQVGEIQKQGEQFAFGLDQDFFDNVQAGVNDALATTPGFKKGGLAMAQSFTIALGQFAHGGPAGIFGGLGALATGGSSLKSAPGFLGPLGFGLSALSTVVGLLDHSAERRNKELIAAIRDLRPVLEAIRVRPIIVGAGGDVAGTVNRIQRRFDRDAIDRGVGAEI